MKTLSSILFSLLVSTLVLAACMIPVPIHPVGAKNLPTPLDQAQVSAIDDFEALFDTWVMFVSTKQPTEEWLIDILMMRSVYNLGIKLDKNSFVKATTWDDIDKVRWSIDNQLEKTSGVCAKNYFELLYTLRRADFLIGVSIESTDATRQTEYRAQAISHLRGALQVAYDCDLADSFTQELNQVAEYVASSAPLDRGDIETKISSILKSASYSVQGQPVPPPTATVPPTPTLAGSVGTDITIALPPGNAKRGEELMVTFACYGCHSVEGVQAGTGFSPANSNDGKWISERAQERWQSDDYTGKAQNAEEYLFEAIVAPDIDVVEGYPAGIHFNNYGARMLPQDVADLIAYMLSLK